MLAIGLAAVLAALFSSCSSASVNYCGAAMCGMSNAHTFCQYTEGPGPKCSGYIDDRLSGEEKTRLIGRMNRRRNEAALGKLQLPSASNMLKLRWVDELAREAQIWSDQCNPPRYPEEHDVCRDLYSITVGQCVASVVGEAPGLRPESMVDMWYLQGRQNTIPTDDKNYPMDFAQMLWAHTYLVGCARSRFMVEQNGRLRTVTRLVCNFAPRGPEGPMWVPGAPASACPARSGPDPVFSGLCTFRHDATFTFDASNTTVLKEQLVLDTILEIEKNDSLNYHGSLDQLYLTKMVSASINNPTEQRCTEKNDIVETEIPDYKEVTINVTDDSTITDYSYENETTKIVNGSSTARETKKILSTVGRPIKSYNIEELSVVNKDTENGTANSVPVKEDNVYNDYDFDDIVARNERDYIAAVTENKVTTATPSVVIESITETIISQRSFTITTYILESTIATYSTVSEVNNATDSPYAEAETTTPYVQNDILKRLLDLSEKTDQNPSDPETARQLEEALENMEKALSSPPVSSKVRRDLRQPQEFKDTPEQRENERIPQKELPKEQTHAQKLKEIGTPDSAPIMAILTKYAPLIKSYENIFKRSDASNTTLSLVVMMLGFLVSSSF